jgi:hypothetical protein
MSAPNQPIVPGSDSSARLVTLPGTGASGPEKSFTEAATEQALQRLRETGSALPPALDRGDGTGQPRNPKGQLAPGREALRDDGRADAPEGGNERPAGDQPQPRTEEPSKGDKPAEGEEAPKEGEGTDTDQPKPELTVKVPALSEGEEELEIELDDPAVAARVNSLLGEAATIERREQQVLDAYTEIDDVRDSIVADPVGFALNLVKSDPEAVEHLVLNLLTSPELWPKLEPVVKKLATDPNELRIVAAEQKGKRADYRTEAQTRVQEIRATRENLQQLQSAIAAMIPEDVDANRAQEMFNIMLGKVGEHATRHNLVTFPLESLGPLLTPTLTTFGIDPVQAAQRGAKVALRRGLPSRKNPLGTRPAASTNGNGSGNGRPAPKKPNGQAFVDSAERRRQAAAPGGGAGSPNTPSDLAPPRNQDGSAMGIEETLKWHRGIVRKRGNALR